MRTADERPDRARCSPNAVFALIFLATFVIAPTLASAEEEITITLEMKDGIMTPNPLQVPANKKFRLEIRNTGTAPAEFESKDLRKEKVIAPGVTSVLVFRPLDAGEYAYFDDFHAEATKDAKLIAK